MQIYKIHSDFYYVKDSNNTEYICKLRDVLKKQKTNVVVGDYVELNEDKNFIVSLLKRKNFLCRPKAANIDLAVVVASLKEPKLDLIQLNRYLTYLKFHNIETAICFNKEDLEDNLEEAKENIIKIYKKLGYELFFISAKNNLDMDELKNFLKGKNIVLTGQSGVGKSTLINALIPDFKARTSEVSAKNQKGRHTTRHCEIIADNNYKITDTPGFSCLKFDFIMPENLVNLFDDIKIYKNSCKYSDCLHNTGEKGVCSVIDNLDKIEKTRYESYLIFLNEALEYKKITSKRSAKKETHSKSINDQTRTKIPKRKRLEGRNTVNQKIEADNE